MATGEGKTSAASAADQASSPSPGAGQRAAGDAVAPAAVAKTGRVRDDYPFSPLDVAQIEALKRRATDLGLPGPAAKKNALLRAGIDALAKLGDEQLRAILGTDATPKEELRQR